MNLVSFAMSFLTPAVVGRMATALGINPALAQMAINAALPAILGAIAGQSVKPAGLGVIGGLLGQQNQETLSQLGKLIGSDTQGALVAAGNGALNSLFGGPVTGTLAGAVGKFAGIPGAASVGLLGMLAPVAFGVLAQQQQVGRLDASGVASLLAGQKNNIAAALPAGFSELLKGTGILGDGLPMTAINVERPAADTATTAAEALKAALTAAATSVMTSSTGAGLAAVAKGEPEGVAIDPKPTTKSLVETATKDVVNSSAAPTPVTAQAPSVAAKTPAVADTIKSVASGATGAVSQSTAAAPNVANPVAAPPPASTTPMGRAAIEPTSDTPTNGGRTMRWLLPLAAALVLGVLGWQFVIGRDSLPPMASPIIYNNVDVGAKATQIYENLKTTIANIKDASLATASLPKLQGAAEQLGDLHDLADKMPNETRKSLAALFTKLEPGLEGLVLSAVNAAGPDSPVKPLLEQVMRRMKALAQG